MTTFFITGAANGIGKCLSEMIYQQGHSVILTDIDEAKLKANALQNGWDENRFLIHQLDVRNVQNWQDTIKAAVLKFKKIDVALNVAGVIRPGYISALTVADIDFMVDINLKGVMYGTKLMAELMVGQGSGQIVNIASLAGVAPIQGLPIYSATKFAVRAFSLAIAQELKQKNVFVSVVCPDLVATNMLTIQLDYEAANLTFSGDKILSVEEISGVILNEAVKNKQLQVLYPWHRGLLARIGNFFPSLSNILTNTLSKKGDQKRKSLIENLKNS